MSDTTNSLKNIPYMVEQVFSFDKGKGITESILAIVLILAFVLLIFFSKENQTLTGLVSVIIGFYFGQKNNIYSEKK